MFGKDVFTFARVRYASGAAGGAFGGGAGWDTDAPDSDLNLSYRLQQMTAIKVDPNGRFVDLTDPALSDFPWLYIAEPGSMYFTPDEVTALRKYLQNGGFLMLDDFWGTQEWNRFAESMDVVFPDRETVEIDNADPVFHSVYDLDDRYQIPGQWALGRGTTYRSDGYRDHWKGIYDDHGRLMVTMDFNSDVGDSWEWADSPRYPEKYSALGIRIGVNYVIYSLTH